MLDPRVLAQLPDHAILQVSVRVGDLRKGKALLPYTPTPALAEGGPS